MKMNYNMRHLLAGAFLASSLLAGSAQVNSPVGDWDCVMSGGGQGGLLVLHFDPLVNNVGAVSGYAIFSSTPKTSSSTDGRPGAIDPDRSGSTGSSSTNAPTSKTNVFGLTGFGGQWGFDSSGKVVGFYSFVVSDVGSDSLTTNSVSFTGKAIANKRLTMVGSTSLGKVTFRGVPLMPVNSALGGSFDSTSWYGVKTVGKQDYQEFLTLYSSGYGPNAYFVEGNGPSYTYSSDDIPMQTMCMISQQKKIAFSILEKSPADTNGVLRATIGSFNNGATAKSNTKGISEVDPKIKFSVTKF